MDPRRRLLDGLMLPHPDDAPFGNPERSGNPLVALAIPPDLGFPVGAVARWHPAVRRTPVPEAAVDEDGDAAAGEDDIGLCPSAIGPNDEVLAKAKPGSM